MICAVSGIIESFHAHVFFVLVIHNPYCLIKVRNVRRPFPARPGAQPINTTDGTADGKINELQNSRIPHYIGTLKRFTNREIGENIWQKSYYDVIIRDREEYIQIWDYIENNPRNPYDE